MKSGAECDEAWLLARRPDADEIEMEKFIERVGKVLNDLPENTPDAELAARERALVWLREDRITASSLPLKAD